MVIIVKEEYGQLQETRELAQEIERIAKEKFNLKVTVEASCNGVSAYANTPLVR